MKLGLLAGSPQRIVHLCNAALAKAPEGRQIHRRKRGDLGLHILLTPAFLTQLKWDMLLAYHRQRTALDVINMDTAPFQMKTSGFDLFSLLAPIRQASKSFSLWTLLKES